MNDLTIVITSSDNLKSLAWSITGIKSCGDCDFPKFDDSSGAGTLEDLARELERIKAEKG